MKGYIDISDKRSKYLKSYFEKNGYMIYENWQDGLDFYYLGKDGHQYEKYRWTSSIIFTLIKNKGIDSYVINDNVEFREQNNILTIIGMIQKLIEDHLIYHQNILILGFGSLAQKLAQSLYLFQNRITIANRNKKNKEQIVQLGYQHCDLNGIKEGYDVIINTIPAKTIDIHQFQQCPIYDLALTQSKQDHYHSLRSLPSVYCPSEAGYILFKTMDKVIKNVKK